MAGVIIALGVTNTLLTALNSPVLKGAFLSCVYADRLEKLKGTVTTVKSVLLDAAKKDELTEIDRDYIDKLKDVVYDADDLFDELVTQADRKNNDIFEKVRRLFPSFKKSRKVKKLESRLKDIAEDRSRFGLISINTIPQERQRVETLSYVFAPTVVGRDDDARKVIGMLLDSANPVNFLTIVGVGGVGKTTLAQLVFDGEWIKSEFDLRLWVCVSDQDGASLNVKSILVKILELLECKTDSSSSTEFLHGEYRRKVQGNRVLLVLDDVWNESTVELNNLKKLLMIGGSGSRIIATTRSKKMAGIVGDGIHELQGLSNDNSRHLFEVLAFGNGSKPTDFVEIAEKIVEKCSNIPLVIKVVGSLLRGQPIGKWQTFLMSKFSEFVMDENDIMSVLKLSYDHLNPSLKSCFAYCAIFPKDYVISKEVLMDLWKAQGFIVPFRESQSIEEAGEEHFSILLQRCFFQDVKRDEYGDVESFKMHDLMHDLAQRVSGNEICVINSSMPDLREGNNVRHLFVHRLRNSNMPNSKHRLHHHLLCGGSTNTTHDFNLKRKIRSYLMLPSSHHSEGGNDSNELSAFEMPKNWGSLRALGLQSANVRLPDTIGNLLHLRYLNLSYSKMKKLPDSIVRLHNLHTLNINHCKLLEEWPKDFTKLVNLTHLYRDFCSKLRYMPVGISKLRHMRTLTEFAADEEEEDARGTQRFAQLRELKDLAMNLKYRISIQFTHMRSTKLYEWAGSCLEDAQHLNEVKLIFNYTRNLPMAEIREQVIRQGGVMEKLKPHRNLRKFCLSNYAGEKIRSWGSAQVNWATVLPHLVHIELIDCRDLQEVPMLSKLPYLKYLSLNNLRWLKYIEEVGSSDTTFFPSLEFLELYNLEDLVGWWKSGDTSDNHCQPSFPKLSKLSIRDCRSLKSFPHCLSRPKLYWEGNNNELRITTADGEQISTRPYSGIYQ